MRNEDRCSCAKCRAIAKGGECCPRSRASRNVGRMKIVRTTVSVLLCLMIPHAARAQASSRPAVTEGDFKIAGYRFDSGEVLPELNLHYRTLGTPARDARGRVTNAVLVMHGTGGTGAQFLSENF